jgi:putative NADH-flavin reductase
MSDSMIMVEKIALFGASGAIGKLVLSEAISQNYKVKCLVRKEGVILGNENIQVVIGDITDEKNVEEMIKDVDIVISTLGPKLDVPRSNKNTPIACSHSLIVKAMEKYQIKRFITIATPSISALEDKKSIAIKIPPFMARILYPNGYREMKSIEKIIKASPLDWTVVRFINPNLKNKNAKYKYSLGDTKFKFSVSRENIATFIIDCINNKSLIRKMPIIYNK